jgi:hypothetical protein
MNHKDVYQKFIDTLPLYAKNTVAWYRNGQNSIRVRQLDGKEFIFTFEEKTSSLKFERTS